MICEQRAIIFLALVNPKDLTCLFISMYVPFDTISTMESIEAVTLGQNTTLSVIVKNPCAKLN